MPSLPLHLSLSSYLCYTLMLEPSVTSYRTNKQPHCLTYSLSFPLALSGSSFWLSFIQRDYENQQNTWEQKWGTRNGILTGFLIILTNQVLAITYDNFLFIFSMETSRVLKIIKIKPLRNRQFFLGSLILVNTRFCRNIQSIVVTQLRPVYSWFSERVHFSWHPRVPWITMYWLSKRNLLPQLV